MSRAKIVDHYITKSLDDGFQIDQVRKELEANNVNGEEISIIVKLVDNAVQKSVITKGAKEKSNELVVAGIILTLIGTVITIGSLMGLFFQGGGFLLVYGPFLGGASMLATGYVTQ